MASFNSSSIFPHFSPSSCSPISTLSSNLLKTCLPLSFQFSFFTFLSFPIYFFHSISPFIQISIDDDPSLASYFHSTYLFLDFFIPYHIINNPFPPVKINSPSSSPFVSLLKMLHPLASTNSINFVPSLFTILSFEFLSILSFPPSLLFLYPFCLSSCPCIKISPINVLTPMFFSSVHRPIFSSVQSKFSHM